MVIMAVFVLYFHGNGLSLYLLCVSMVTDLTLCLQDFAETTMNELLGWYGYDKVDEGDTEKLDLQQFAPSAGRGKNYTPSGGRNSVLTPSEQRDSSSRNSVDSVGQISSDGSSGTVGLHSIRINTSQLTFHSYNKNASQ